ncbi:MAG: hypothetical protein OXI39_10465 [Gemmatimonadota bacterium]|uniref:hypothetical protein n=1 Tax=Candidatus Palauibacter scopulicola TaxID=3056741 RepID=UPI00238B09EE|nr:hypothetical protein [Candidatus Palauibacter scopulicola]MDE2663410.1 hypothetical protein [Candidatus Palauibacter scopulicola]
MIWILADTRSDAERIRRAAGAAAHVVDGEGELTAGDNGASSIIVGCGLRSLRARTELLADLGLRRPWVPVILVTDRDADIARALIFSLDGRSLAPEVPEAPNFDDLRETRPLAAMFASTKVSAVPPPNARPRRAYDGGIIAKWYSPNDLRAARDATARLRL